MAESSGLMRGKRGLIMGVANNRSIAWGIAKACRRMAPTSPYLSGRRAEEARRALAEEVDGLVVGHCDVTDPASHRRGVRGGQIEMGLARFPGACHRLFRQGPA
jgi:enoyl-[acyl-carrier protein] reductase I